jgi:hypothetical protein
MTESQEFDLRRRPDEVNALQDIVDRGCHEVRFSRTRGVIINEGGLLTG